ncbi:MAG: acyl-CoA reductase [Chitinophagaceae bacterium]
MILAERIDLLSRLGLYIKSKDTHWQQAKQKASIHNPWFTPGFIEISANNIAGQYLQKEKLMSWARQYLLDDNNTARVVGIVMAGNIPMVGFHDLLAVFLSGHKAVVKLSSKDDILIKHLVKKMQEWNSDVQHSIQFADMLKNCDAYIATGSTNTSRYFEHYFGKYPHIIRKNKTSVAVLSGKESNDDLEKLADDVYQFFGLGCRNVKKLYVPNDYDFVPLLAAFKKYHFLSDHHKYKNNYDYNLALLILNKKFYMTNGSILLVEDPSVFSPISQLNFEYYTDVNALKQQLAENESIQAIVGDGFIEFGNAQCPALTDYADKTDTLAFLKSL